MRHLHCLPLQLGFVIKHVLLVEPDNFTRAALVKSVAFIARVDACPDFPSARPHVIAAEYDLLVTNLRLGAFNGLHLVYLAQGLEPRLPSIVYTDRYEAPLAVDVQAAAAFYELRDRLLTTFPQYVSASLPPVDRRNASIPDRRRVFRGGRRAADVAPTASH